MRIRKPSLPSNWPSKYHRPAHFHFDEVEDFLTSDPVTTADLRRMAIASGGAQVARLRGIDRK